MIEDHFDSSFELERTLTERGRKSELDLLTRDLPGAGQTSFTRQQAPLGLGHAVWCARDLVGNEPFALLLPDMIVQAGTSGKGCLAEMLDVYNSTGGNIIRKDYNKLLGRLAFPTLEESHPGAYSMKPRVQMMDEMGIKLIDEDDRRGELARLFGAARAA